MDDDDESEAMDGMPIELVVGAMGGRLWFTAADADATRDDYVATPGRDEAIVAIEDALTRHPPRSLAVVAENGVGKSTLIREATRRLHAQGATVFEATATDVIAGQTYIGQMEERVQELARASAGRPVVWVLPDIHAAVGAGVYHGNPQGLLDRMLPFLARGELQVVAEATPTAWARVEQLRPQVAAAFEPVRLAPVPRDAALRIASEWLERRGVAVAERTLLEALELADEHLPAAASPGQLLKLVRSAHERLQREDAVPPALEPEHLLATVAALSGLPVDMLDERRALDLRAVRRFFEERVLGQPEAVTVLVERIALIKAGLTDPTRPLGVFLFVGPTGTGKTELAKALAEYLFGSASRLVRLDMSEFQTSDSVERLLAGPESGEAAALVGSVREQPFSIILLDELEKAHPRVWDVFLQLFDDGRLTDRAGRTVDFRHTVVIMTSNLGAGERRTALGFSGEPGTSSSANVDRSVAEAFRPEFVNRIDRIVVFRRLTRDVMRLLVRKELADVTRRRGLRTRPWSVEWDESAVEFLLQQGFTQDLGARPLKRAIDTHVLAPLARAIVEHKVPRGDQFLLVAAGPGGIDADFIDPDGGAAPAGTPEAPAEPPEGLTLRAVALEPSGSAAEAAFLAQELDALAARMAAGRMTERKDEALARLATPGFWEQPDRFGVLGLVEQLDRLEAGVAGAGSLLRRLERATGGRDGGSGRLASLLAQRLHLLDRALDALEGGEPSDGFVTITADDEDPEAVAFAGRVADMYRRWARRCGMELEDLGDGDGALLGVSGFAAWTILRREAGLHVLELPRRDRAFSRAVVRVATVPQPEAPRERDGAARRAQALATAAASPAPRQVVRRYRAEPSPLVRDTAGWRTGRLDRVLAGDFDLFG